MNPLNGGWLIALTLLGAMVLAVARLPDGAPHWLTWLRPEWGVALLFCWTVAAPARVGMAWAWIAGLFFDALLGPSYPLGIHGACFAFAVFVAAQLHERLRMYNLLQQALVAFFVVLVALLFQGVVRATVTDHVQWTWFLVLPAVTTMLVYPLLAVVVGGLADRFAR